MKGAGHSPLPHPITYSDFVTLDMLGKIKQNKYDTQNTSYVLMKQSRRFKSPFLMKDILRYYSLDGNLLEILILLEVPGIKTTNLIPPIILQFAKLLQFSLKNLLKELSITI